MITSQGWLSQLMPGDRQYQVNIFGWRCWFKRPPSTGAHRSGILTQNHTLVWRQMLNLSIAFTPMCSSRRFWDVHIFLLPFAFPNLPSPWFMNTSQLWPVPGLWGSVHFISDVPGHHDVAISHLFQGRNEGVDVNPARAMQCCLWASLTRGC